MHGCGRTTQERELRNKLFQELESKSKACANPSYQCTIPRIDGYDYCIRHILRDTAAPYRQCSYTYANGRKCTNALLKHDTKKDPAMTTLCFEHSRRQQLQKTRLTVGKLVRADTNEALLQNITHHVNVGQLEPPKAEQDEEIDVVSAYVHPYVNHENINDFGSIMASIKRRKRVLDYASDSSSDESQVPTLANTNHTIDIESDAESIDSQDDDLLKRAGVFTRQEAIHISEAKLTKLQGLYIEQINRLNYTLKEQRRRYLHAIRKERESLCSIHDQLKHNQRERFYYDRLKALNTYHRRHGVEAVLYKKLREKRAKTAAEGVTVPTRPTPNATKCTFTEGGVKCGERTLPCCKFCRKHILEDKKQTLFRACAVERSGVVCQEPVLSIFDEPTCPLHLAAPTPRQYVQKKSDSETEDEDESHQKPAPKIEPKVEVPAVEVLMKTEPVAVPAVEADRLGVKVEAIEGVRKVE